MLLISITNAEYGNSSKYEETKKKIARDLESIALDFVANVSFLYRIAAEYPTDTKDEIVLKIKKSNNYSARLGAGSSVAAILGGGGAVIGGSLGALTAALLTGGVGAGAGALLGAQIGGIFGSAIGSLAAFSDDDDIIKISLESKDIEKIVSTALATIWALSNSGYGRGRGVSDDEIMKIETIIENLQSKNIIYDWHGLSKQRLIEHSNHILTLLEEKEEIN